MDAKIYIIIVDDESPWPPDAELQDLKIPSAYDVRVIKRSNGGPAPARNTGLDAITAGTDFVAFIDSDDTWEAVHIQRALDALGSGFDLYFSDYTTWDSRDSHLKATKFLRENTAGGTLKQLAGQNAKWICPKTFAISYLLEDFIAHLSTIVYRTSAFNSVRFIEDMVPGEDHLFFMDLIFRCAEVCFSTEIEAHLGRGVNIYRSTTSYDWDSPETSFDVQATLPYSWKCVADIHYGETRMPRFQQIFGVGGPYSPFS